MQGGAPRLFCPHNAIFWSGVVWRSSCEEAEKHPKWAANMVSSTMEELRAGTPNE